ncbi:MAG: hypothetical protein Q9157_008249 [Trypethelium eluteriae]
MFSLTATTLLTTLLTLASASPLASLTLRQTYQLAVDYNSAPGMSPAEWSGPVLVPIAMLTTFPGAPISASALRIDNETDSGLVLKDIECRAYRDTAGVETGSAPFTLAQEALLSTNLASVSSVLCYVTESD